MKNIFKKRRERITLFRGQNKREDAYKAKEIPDDLFRICKRCKTCGSFFHIVNPYFAGFRKSCLTKT